MHDTDGMQDTAGKIADLEIRAHNVWIGNTGDAWEPGEMGMVSTAASLIASGDPAGALDVLLSLQQLLHDEAPTGTEEDA